MHGSNPVLVVSTRGPLVENRHRAAVALASVQGGVVEAWGEVTAPVLPRSSVKMIQALPLLESGAAAALGLGSEHLALACASHQGAPMHVERVAAWLAALGLGEEALGCGPQPPRDPAMKGQPASRVMNNCSGKHVGFLTLAEHLGAGTEGYLDPDGAVQRAVAAAFAETTGVDTPLAYGIDGCSAPNFAAPLAGIAQAMAGFAEPTRWGGARGEAASRLVAAMAAHPLLVSGEGRACAALQAASEGRAVVKTGADGVYAGIVPGRGLGFCLKVEDGSRLAAEALCAAVLVRVGALEPGAARPWTDAPIRNWNGEVTGQRRVELP